MFFTVKASFDIISYMYVDGFVYLPYLCCNLNYIMFQWLFPTFWYMIESTHFTRKFSRPLFNILLAISALHPFLLVRNHKISVSKQHAAYIHVLCS